MVGQPLSRWLLRERTARAPQAFVLLGAHRGARDEAFENQVQNLVIKFDRLGESKAESVYLLIEDHGSASEAVKCGRTEID